MPCFRSVRARGSKSLLAVAAIAVACIGARGSLAQSATQSSTTRSYELRQTTAAAARATLVERLGNPASAASIIADPRRNRLIVLGPDTLHAAVQALLPQVDVRGAAVTKPPSESPPASQSLRLTTLTAQQLHARLEQALGKAMPQHGDSTGQWVRFAIDAGGGAVVSVWANPSTGEMQLRGPADRVKAWAEIVRQLDAPPGATSVALFTPNPRAATQVQQVASQMSRGRLAAQRTDASAGEDADNPLGSLLGPVEIINVEGSDVLLLRGNPRDVARVQKVLQEIEQASLISEPSILIVQVQHVESAAVAELVQTLFDQALSARYGYGRIVAVPLVKPNAVLLVGLRGTVQKAREILTQLDQPGESLTQFEVFRLEHARAEAALPIVQGLFESEGGRESVPTLQPKALIVADERTNALVVRASPRDMLEVRALVDELDQPGSAAVNELRVFKLKNTVASELEEVLREALTGDDDSTDPNESLTALLQLVTIDSAGQRRLKSGVLANTRITADPVGNALVATGPAEGMALLEALINQLDRVPDASAELKVFTIVNGDAVALSEMLSGLFGTGEGQGGGNNQNEQLFQLRFEVDERTNSIIAAGTADELLVVEAILLRLDGSDASQRQNRVYRLNNSSAEEVALVLQNWLQAERSVLETAPGQTSPFQQIEREVVVVADIASNSLVVSSTPRYYEEVRQIIEELDVQAPMVMIQVLIAELELGDADEFGIELGLQDSLLFDRSLLSELDTTINTTTITTADGVTNIAQEVIQGAQNTPGFEFGNPATGLPNSGSDASVATAGRVAAQGLASFGVGRISPDLGIGGLVLSASSDSVSTLLRALQQSSRLEVLSRPQIMALDNQPGRAFVGETVPYIRGTAIDPSGSRTNDIELEDVGIDLVVTPRISPDGLVVMTVTADNSSLGPVSEGVPVSIAPNGDAINAPIISRTFAETTVSAVSGQTVVLSGLLRKREFDLHRRVPLLADIPLLGDLFRYDQTSTARTELLIILTPHVVQSRVESEMLKQVESARMSWCLSDVVDLHGPAGLRSRNDPIGGAEAEAVYPEVIPEGELSTPIEFGPTPAAPPGGYDLTLPPPTTQTLPPEGAEKKPSRFSVTNWFKKSEP
ncbi:MAG: secretin N-terminal domain-containing protein [Planctomycetota bacterium]